MVSLKIVDTDLFLEMPASTQNLYFHLITRADDDGFLGNSRKIMKIIGASEDDMKILFSKMLVIPFESGVCVIKHWKIHNYIRGDRYTETIYKDEKNSLSEEHNKVYIPNNSNIEQNVIPQDIPNGYHMDTEVRVGKVKLGKYSIGKKESVFNGFQPANNERDYSKEYKPLRIQWNDLKLPECRYTCLNLPNWSEIMNSMQLYTFDEIEKSITNYSELITRESAIRYSTFPNFLVKGIQKYADSSMPYQQFKESEEERLKKIKADAWEKEKAK